MTENPPEELDLAASREKYKKLQAEKDAEEEPLHLPVFRVSIKHYLVPIIVAITCTCILSYVLFFGANFQEQAALISGEMFQDVGDSLFFGIVLILVVAVTAILMIKIVKRFGIKGLRVVFVSLFLIMGAILIIFFGSGFLEIFSFPSESLYGLIVFGIIGGFLLAYVFYAERFSVRAKDITILIYSILIGTFLGILLPTWTAMILLISLSIFDLISVFRGPTKKMLELIDEEIQKTREEAEKATIAEVQSPKVEAEKVPVTDVQSPKVEVENEKEENTEGAKQEEEAIEIGIGDLTFYSFFAANALIYTNSFMVMLFTAIGILIGAVWTLSFIRHNKILPGLPLSMFIGIALYWLGVFVNTHVQFLLFFH